MSDKKHPVQLGKYRITEVLGEGAMGVVYKGFDPDIQRTVALKTIRTQLDSDDDSPGAPASRFRNEAQAAGRLMHPGIVAVYDFGRDQTGVIEHFAAVIITDVPQAFRIHAVSRVGMLAQIEAHHPAGTILNFHLLDAHLAKGHGQRTATDQNHAGKPQPRYSIKPSLHRCTLCSNF